MLTPEYLDGISEPLQAVYSDLEARIMADIARRIAGAEYVMTPSAEWQIYKLQQMGLAQEYINQEVARSLKISQKTLNEIFKNAGIKSMKTDIETQKAAIEAGKLPEGTIPLSASKALTQVINANALRTHNTLRKMTGTIAIDVNGKINKYMDMCQLMVQSGAFTQQAAIDVAVRRFSAEGVGAFDYISGVQTSIEAAVRRACITGVNQATAEVSLNNAEELETDLVEVTSHADARPDHAEWQGKVYSISGKSKKYRPLREATGYGTVTGLCGANCRHSFYAFIEGVSEKVKPEKYDQKLYDNEQKQRHNERMIRTWKKRAATLEAGGVDATAAKRKVSEWQARQRAFLNEAGLTRDYSREKIYTGVRADDSQQQYERYKGILGPEYLPKSLKEFQNLKYSNSEEYGILKSQIKGMGYYNKAIANEPGITEHVKSVAGSVGMDAAGLEYRIKSKDSYLRKIRSRYDPDGNEYEVKDILRYTYTADANEMTGKTLSAIDTYKNMGYNTVEVKNYWLNDQDPYNGINTIINAPVGQKFELQYHTPESFELKNGKLHKLYEKQRLIKDTSSKEYMKLTDEMFKISDKLTVPIRISEVKK